MVYDNSKDFMLFWKYSFQNCIVGLNYKSVLFLLHLLQIQVFLVVQSCVVYKICMAELQKCSVFSWRSCKFEHSFLTSVVKLFRDYKAILRLHRPNVGLHYQGWCIFLVKEDFLFMNIFSTKKTSRWSSLKGSTKGTFFPRIGRQWLKSWKLFLYFF